MARLPEPSEGDPQLTAAAHPPICGTRCLSPAAQLWGPRPPQVEPRPISQPVQEEAPRRACHAGSWPQTRTRERLPSTLPAPRGKRGGNLPGFFPKLPAFPAVPAPLKQSKRSHLHTAEFRSCNLKTINGDTDPLSP